MTRLPSWFASPPPDAAVEIAAERVSAAIIGRRGGDATILAHASEPLPAGVVTPSMIATNLHDRGVVTGALRRVFDSLPGKPRRIALVIPDSAARLSLVRFDRVPARREDLDQLVRWQVRKAIPFGVEEAAVTYAEGARTGGEGREFLVTVARRHTVAEYEGVVESAGAYAGLVDIATISLANMYLAAPSPPTGDWLLVHVRADSTSVVILRGEDVIFFRNRPEEEQESIADLVHQTAMYYQDRLSGAGFTRVIVAGGGRDPGAVEAARRDVRDRLGHAVEQADPTKAAALSERLTASSGMLDALGPLVGMSLRTLRERVMA
jgi:type IV pilus assembly protein PilM